MPEIWYTHKNLQVFLQYLETDRSITFCPINFVAGKYLFFQKKYFQFASSEPLRRQYWSLTKFNKI